MTTQPLTIRDWELGITDSPNYGISLMRNVDIEALPGSIRSQKKPETMFPTAISVVFTANSATDTFTIATPVVPLTGVAVTVSNSGGGLPAGLSAATNYFIIKLSPTTFQLATNIQNANAGTAINITTNGTGTQTVTTVNPSTLKHIIKDPRTSSYYAQDSGGRVWYTNGSNFYFLLNGNTITGAAGNGIVLFTPTNGSSTTYLFVFRNAAIDAINVFLNSGRENPSWTNDWVTGLNSGAGSGNSHHTIVGQDNIIYYVDDRYVGSIKENLGATLDIANPATYTVNLQALDMPQGEVNEWLTELGTNLLTAGGKYNYIYPWNRLASSYTLPIEVPENSVKKIKNIGGTVYILAGTKGNIYTTQGTYCRFVKSIPAYMSNTSMSLTPSVVTWGGIGVRNGAFIFGAGCLTTANSGTYLLYPDGRLVLDCVPSTGATNATAIFADNDFYVTGYSGGGDASGTTHYSNYESVAHSALYRVANKTEKAVFSTIEVQMARPASGCHVRLSWRGDDVSSFTTITTFTGDSTTTSFEYSCGLNDLENIQILLEFDGDAEIMEVRLFP